MKIPSRILLVLALSGSVFGCATVKSIAKACAPATTDETQAVTDLFSRPDLTTAEKIATAEGGKIAICVVSQIAKDVIDKVAALAFSAPPSFAGQFFEEPPLVEVSRTWLQKHPQ